MNQFQQDLYDNLMALVQDSETFYFQDFQLDGLWYRIFNYRLASYTEFLKPGGIECRGVMFQVEKSGSPEVTEVLRIAALPMEKFFNLHENPLTMNIDLSTIDLIEDKADGSLISTFIHAPYASDRSRLRVKSKGSVASTQCEDALRWLSAHSEFQHELATMTSLGYTVNLEWVAPDNRIVIGYMEPMLRVLNIRNTMNGKYLDKTQVHPSYEEILKRWVDQIVVINTIGDESAVAVAGEVKVLNLKKFVEMIPEMEQIEGFVVRLTSGQRIKIKTKWYLALHHTKDSINSDRRLYEAVLSEATDDLRALFYDDALAIARIEKMEQYVDGKYNHLVATVEKFYETNKELERKEYAILGQKEMDRLQFGLAMKKYLGQEVNYKDFMIAKWKEFGVKDDPEPSVQGEIE